MNINDIKSEFPNHSFKKPDDVKKQNSDLNTKNLHTKENKLSDRLEISKEAHQLQEETLVQTDLARIKEKVEKKEYDDPAIIEKVAELILKEIAG